MDLNTFKVHPRLEISDSFLLITAITYPRLECFLEFITLE